MRWLFGYFERAPKLFQALKTEGWDNLCDDHDGHDNRKELQR